MFIWLFLFVNIFQSDLCNLDFFITFYRREKQEQNALAFSWYAENDSHCPIKLAKDRSSFIKLWRQQIQQFQNVSQEVAEAIVSHYPSPRLLLKVNIYIHIYTFIFIYMYIF